MVTKRLLRPERLCAVPSQFSRLDCRLVRGRHLDRCSTEVLAPYLFLVTVADAKGLSYYGDARRQLCFFAMALCHSRLMHVEFTVSQTMEHFLGCHVNAFEALGGVPAKIMVCAGQSII